MQQRNWYAGDLHEHSIYSSPVYGGTDSAPDSLVEVRDFMKSKGLSFGAASDHHNILNHAEWLALEEEDFLPFISKEISTGGGHILALNTPVDVIFPDCDMPHNAARRKGYLDCIHLIRSHGGLAQLNHPCELKKAIALPEAYYDILPAFDTMEIWNGSETMEEGTKNGRAFALWMSLLRRGIYLPATTGTDQHRLHEYMQTRQIKTVVYADALTRRDILDAIRQGHSFLTSGPTLHAEIGGMSFGQSVPWAEELKIEVELDSPADIDVLRLHTQKETIEVPVGAAKWHSEIKVPADAEFVVLEAGTDTYCKAIGNPIWIEGVPSR